MADKLNKIIRYDKRLYILIAYVDSLDMFCAQEFGRKFKTLIPSELINNK